MQRIAAVLLRHGPSQLSRPISHIPPSSFSPENYFRFPQFLHDINNKLTIYKDTQCTGVLRKGRLIYANKCVTVEEQAQLMLEELSDTDRNDLNELSVACKGLFWQSDIDYTIVPCAFQMEGHFTANRFLTELGLDSPAIMASTKFCYFSRGMLPSLPIISYQGEDAMNVYKSPQDVISSILEKYDEVYHVTVGEDVISPVLQFVVAKTDSLMIGFMSASIEEE